MGVVLRGNGKILLTRAANLWFRLAYSIDYRDERRDERRNNIAVWVP